ncbi:AbgT family transporter [Brevibacterium sp. BRM-1]|uniref:YfcC family protein n=1 Tax=Brevibacterium sp. BRM-1 TaxID=2999062 RepID=UPI00227FF29F|nr:AbgT family transporter [Brevibacterium sp. BRM-1]WAL39412.1 AbgT family transporter [Brevibacterium sp. BRM-1]
MNTAPARPRKGLRADRVPHTFVILFGITVLLGIATYLIPAGEYDKRPDSAGRDLVISGTYHAVAAAPASPADLFMSVLAGMEKGAEIIFFLLIIGGCLGVLNSTGAVDRMLRRVLARFAGRELFIIPVVLGFFALAGATFGMSEEAIPYLIIILPILQRIGFDRILIAALPLVGTAVGWAGSITNPFNIGIAQQIAGVPLFSGMAVRAGLLVILYVVAAAYFMRYGAKILKDPNKSLVGMGAAAPDGSPQPAGGPDGGAGDPQDGPFTARDIAIVCVFVAAIVTVPVGIIAFGWFIAEMSAVFIVMALIVAVIARMDYNAVAETFTAGCKDLLVAALSVGLAYSGIVLLTDAHVLDTIVYGMASAVGSLSSTFAAGGMVVAQSAINYLVSSGSGQAALTMPIMAPLSDLVGVSRQTAVLAFQFGDGISNCLTPTSGSMMAGLAIAGVSWFTWARFLLPLMGVFYAIGCAYVIVVHMFIWTV